MNHNRFFALYVACACALLLAVSCTDTDPVQPDENDSVDSLARGVYILCEGLWKMDNSTLTRYNPDNGRVENNIFRRANPGLRIGDTGNDIVLRGDTAFVAVTTSRTIEVFRASTGRWLTRVQLGEGKMPRYIAFAPDGLYVSTYTHNTVSRLDPVTLLPVGADIFSGPAVEGIAYAGNAIFAANSGLGALQIDSPGAGTISVIRSGASAPDSLIASVPNVVELKASPDGTRLYAFSQEISSRPDLKPVIIEYNAHTFAELRRWEAEGAGSPCITPNGDSLFFVSKRGVEVIDLRSSGTPAVVVQKDRPDDNWYSLGLHPTDGTLWIGNARGFTTEGEVIIANRSGAYIKRFEVGLNPTAIVFFGY